MRFYDYQTEAKATAVYPKEIAIPYCTLGLCGEAGEVAEKVKKLYRDKGGVIDDEFREAVSKEIGDVLWYLSQLATELEMSLESLAIQNIYKLKSRAERGKLGGSGDNR